jgi:sugar lactone lactonase YvrE
MVGAAAGDVVADAVLGQPNFTTSTLPGGDRSGIATCGPTTTARRLCAPEQVAVSPSERLFVVDIGNNRVLSWRNALTFKNGAPADLVLGQPDFVSTIGGCGSGPNDHSFCQPSGVAADRNGRVFVSDPPFNRVLRFSPPFKNGQRADLVIGQRDFSSRIGGCGTGLLSEPPSARNLCGPSFLAVDRHDALYVTDSQNGRILRFTPPLVSNPAADLVLGQPDFLHPLPNEPVDCKPPSAHDMCNPAAVAVDQRGAVFVSDILNNRVLRFSPPLASGKAADLVLGQRNLTTVQQRCIIDEHVVNASLMCSPIGLAVDQAGNLYVSEGNNRVLRFARPSLIGQPANLVVGQPNFTTFACNTGGVSARSLCGPAGVAVDLADNLFIADTFNNRVLRFDKL